MELPARLHSFMNRFGLGLFVLSTLAVAGALLGRVVASTPPDRNLRGTVELDAAAVAPDANQESIADHAETVARAAQQLEAAIRGEHFADSPAVNTESMELHTIALSDASASEEEAFDDPSTLLAETLETDDLISYVSMSPHARFSAFGPTSFGGPIAGGGGPSRGGFGSLGYVMSGGGGGAAGGGGGVSSTATTPQTNAVNVAGDDQGSDNSQNQNQNQNQNQSQNDGTNGNQNQNNGGNPSGPQNEGNDNGKKSVPPGGGNPPGLGPNPDAPEGTPQQPVAVPEPASLLLAGVGLAGLMTARRRRSGR